MAPNKGKCICDVNDNNEFICSIGCINSGKKCNSNKDCKPKSIKKKKGGNKNKTIKIKKFIGFKNSQVRSLAIEIYLSHKRLPDEITRYSKSNNIKSVKYNNIEGFDTLELFNKPTLKLHPIKAIVFVVAGKYIYIPDHLLGPLKYASETINIEQLFINEKDNMNYQKTGEKRVSLVTGSCASLTISAITIKFVEDMVHQYNDFKFYGKQLNKLFRDEYDKRVSDYLCGKGIVPNIPWYLNVVERNKLKGPFNSGQRKKIGCNKMIFEDKNLADLKNTL